MTVLQCEPYGDDYEYTGGKSKEAMMIRLLFMFFKKHIKYIKKLLNIHIFFIDRYEMSQLVFKAYRRQKSLV